MKYLLPAAALLFMMSCDSRPDVQENKQQTTVAVDTVTPAATPATDVPEDQLQLQTPNLSPMIATGDLNGDELADSVTVLQDTSNKSRPYRLEIFFAAAGGHYKQVLSSDKAIKPQRPGGKDMGNTFEAVKIESGVLSIAVVPPLGRYEHKFRYQDGRFALISYTSTQSDGKGTATHIDFNLLSGHYIKAKTSYQTQKVYSSFDKVVQLNPLPSLADFAPHAYRKGEIEF